MTPQIQSTPTPDGGVELRTTCPNGPTPAVTVYAVPGSEVQGLRFAEATLAANHRRATSCRCLQQYDTLPAPDHEP